MREADMNRKLFHRGHYEIIAARFRNNLEQYGAPIPSTTQAINDVRNAIVELALEFAQRLQTDNEDFDPLIFLDKCSPDPERYPLSELWADFNG